VTQGRANQTTCNNLDILQECRPRVSFIDQFDHARSACPLPQQEAIFRDGGNLSQLTQAAFRNSAELYDDGSLSRCRMQQKLHGQPPQPRGRLFHGGCAFKDMRKIPCAEFLPRRESA